MKKLFKFLIFIGALIGFFFIFEKLPKAISYQKEENPWKSDKVLIIPHGGAKELYPENTIYSFKETDIYDAFEVDLALTSDNILISHHDLDLGMFLGENYKNTFLRSKTYDEIVQLIKDGDYTFARNFNYQHSEEPDFDDEEVLKDMVPATLEWLFSNYPDKLYILEIKDMNIKEDFKKAIEVLFDLIDLYEMEDQIIISSFNDDVIKEILKERKMHTSTGPKETFKFILMSAFNIDFFYKPKQAALIIPVNQKIGGTQNKLVNFLPVKNKFMKNSDTTDLGQAGIIDDAHRHNMAIIYWTINDENEMRKLIELGVDGLITDRPDLLKQILEEYENN